MSSSKRDIAKNPMRRRLLWETVWPWLYYELIASFVYLLYGWFFGEMGSMLISMTAASLILVPVYYYRESRKEEEGGALQSRSKRPVLSGFFGLAVTASSACIFFNLLFFLLGLFRLTDSHEAVNEVLFGAPFWLQLLVMGAAAPFTEELIYRGLAYRRLRTVMGVLPAAGLSALFFALTHGNLLQGIYTAALGMLLALVYETYGFAAAVWFHAWANLTSIGMNQFVALLPELVTAPWFAVLLLAAGGVGTAAGTANIIKKIH